MLISWHGRILGSRFQVPSKIEIDQLHTFARRVFFFASVLLVPYERPTFKEIAKYAYQVLCS
jgi:hypothetical protein